MLLKSIDPSTQSDTVYPVIQTEISEPSTQKLFFLPSGCFHDLSSEDDEELAGMGLAIIGNVCKLMHEAFVRHQEFEPSLWLKLVSWQSDKDRLPLPWPGMLNDDPTLPLQPGSLPFEEAMFLDDNKDFKHRVDRLVLMRRIQETWLPYLKLQMARAG